MSSNSIFFRSFLVVSCFPKSSLTSREPCQDEFGLKYSPVSLWRCLNLIESFIFFTLFPHWFRRTKHGKGRSKQKVKWKISTSILLSRSTGTDFEKSEKFERQGWLNCVGGSEWVQVGGWIQVDGWVAKIIVRDVVGWHQRLKRRK